MTKPPVFLSSSPHLPLSPSPLPPHYSRSRLSRWRNRPHSILRRCRSRNLLTTRGRFRHASYSQVCWRMICDGLFLFLSSSLFPSVFPALFLSPCLVFSSQFLYLSVSPAPFFLSPEVPSLCVSHFPFLFPALLVPSLVPSFPN